MKNDNFMKSNANGATNCCAYEIFPYVGIKDEVVRRNDTDFEEVARNHLADGHIPRMIAKVPSKHFCVEDSVKALSRVAHTRSHTSYT